MNSTERSMANSPEQNTKRSSWQLIAMLAVTVIPIVAAYFVYYTGIGVPDEGVNQGTLVSGEARVQKLLESAQGDLPGFEANRQWRLLIPVPAACNQSCQDHLYLTRQVHIRLGDKADRVARFAINLGADEGAALLDKISAEHPKLKYFSVPEKMYSKWLAGTNIPADASEQHYVLLVDQVGNAMMYYDAENNGNEMLKDIKRVLRYSPE